MRGLIINELVTNIPKSTCRLLVSPTPGAPVCMANSTFKTVQYEYCSPISSVNLLYYRDDESLYSTRRQGRMLYCRGDDDDCPYSYEYSTVGSMIGKSWKEHDSPDGRHMLTLLCVMPRMLGVL